MHENMHDNRNSLERWEFLSLWEEFLLSHPLGVCMYAFLMQSFWALKAESISMLGRQLTTEPDKDNKAYYRILYPYVYMLHLPIISAFHGIIDEFY